MTTLKKFDQNDRIFKCMESRLLKHTTGLELQRRRFIRKMIRTQTGLRLELKKLKEEKMKIILEKQALNLQKIDELIGFSKTAFEEENTTINNKTSNKWLVCGEAVQTSYSRQKDITKTQRENRRPLSAPLRKSRKSLNSLFQYENFKQSKVGNDNRSLSASLDERDAPKTVSSRSSTRKEKVLLDDSDADTSLSNKCNNKTITNLKTAKLNCLNNKVDLVISRPAHNDLSETSSTHSAYAKTFTDNRNGSYFSTAPILRSSSNQTNRKHSKLESNEKDVSRKERRSKSLRISSCSFKENNNLTYFSSEITSNNSHQKERETLTHDASESNECSFTHLNYGRRSILGSANRRKDLQGNQQHPGSPKESTSTTNLNQRQRKNSVAVRSNKISYTARLSVIRKEMVGHKIDPVLALRKRRQQIENEDVTMKVWSFIGTRPVSMSFMTCSFHNDYDESDGISENEDDAMRRKIAALPRFN